MNSLLGLLTETPVAAEPSRVTPIREQDQLKALFPASPVRDDQIRTLVQQLFFRQKVKPVRHVGFAAVEASMETAPLCIEVARVLAEDNRYDVGLIDACGESATLQTKLQIAPPNHAEDIWPIAPRLWMVPRQSWLPEGCGQRISEQKLLRLRELTAEFDFSILSCAPVSWLTASVGQICDGLVLVLTANTTRRLVVTHIKNQLNKAEVPLLGTVLAERCFPVPEGLYRSL